MGLIGGWENPRDISSVTHPPSLNRILAFGCYHYYTVRSGHDFTDNRLVLPVVMVPSFTGRFFASLYPTVAAGWEQK